MPGPPGTATHGTVRAPAAAAGAQLDGDGAGQLAHGEDAALAGRLHQLDALAVELRGQRAAHGLVGEGGAVTRQAGSLVEIQHFLSAREAGGSEARGPGAPHACGGAGRPPEPTARATGSCLLTHLSEPERG